MYVVLVAFTIKAEAVTRFVERVKHQATDSLNNETECHRFDVCVDAGNDQHVLLYEIYSDQAAFETHLQTEHFICFNQETSGWIIDKKINLFNKVG